MGLGARRWLQRHIRLLFRFHLAAGSGCCRCSRPGASIVTSATSRAIGVLLFAQLLSVSVAARVFRRRTDGRCQFRMFGNPTFWTAPVAAAAIGAEAAVFVIAYDMLTQADRARRAVPPAEGAEGAITRDGADRLCADLRRGRRAAVGLCSRRRRSSTRSSPGLGIVMAGVGALLLGVAWPRRWIGKPQSRTRCGASRCTTLVGPVALATATLAGIDLPGAVWILAFGPAPRSVVSFAQLYGYSPRTAATGLALSVGAAIALLPVSLTLAAETRAARGTRWRSRWVDPGRDERGRASHVDGQGRRVAFARRVRDRDRRDGVAGVVEHRRRDRREPGRDEPVLLGVPVAARAGEQRAQLRQ